MSRESATVCLVKSLAGSKVCTPKLTRVTIV